jgi:hypothetical protein
MKYPLEEGLLLIQGNSSFLLIGKAKDRFSLCIETSTEEFCQGVTPGDVIVVSAPEGGEVEPALMLMELVRTYHVPLLVLPRNHPGSRRISRVVSVAPEVHTSCSITRGTHPEQHLVCSSDELAGLSIRGTSGGLEITGLPADISLKVVNYQVVLDYS